MHKGFKTPFEISGETATATYEEGIAWYAALDEAYDEITMLSYGTTDAGKPLHLIVISNDGSSDPEAIKADNKRILLVNNAIHAGEPDGVDASMMLARDLLQRKDLKGVLEHTVIVVIPFYNVEGVLNRGCCSRANQNGPVEYGFRGNGRNLDLNRDFIKCDSRNAQTFAHIFSTWQPDLLIDNHVTNGADYQYTMTYIATHRNRLEKVFGTYFYEEFIPALKQKMIERKYELVPYVELMGEIPDSGMVDWVEVPRFSQGYSALWNTPGFVAETHMLKPFNERVWSTYEFMLANLQLLNNDSEKFGKLRKEAIEQTKKQWEFTIAWEPDFSIADSFFFKGYEAGYKKSEINDHQRLYYDQSRPYTRYIPFYTHYKASVTVKKPVGYVIPQAWHEVIERLKLNKVEMIRLTKEQSIQVEVLYIKSYETAQRPYEGHYLHSQTKVERDTQTINYRPGDYIVWTGQVADRLLIETLEPEAPDSYFNWNFFDAILQQKEHFSDYVFEDLAAMVLEENAQLKKNFDNMLKNDTAFSNDAHAQLVYIYKNSPYYEPSAFRYPVTRIY
ncbi:MAG: hypothetical protein M3Q97_00985 [Bacteroidota bacterium]|nr:hypothetical protein [Bacteroidota bacterium]